MTAEPHRTGGAWSAVIAGGAFGLVLIVGSVALRPPIAAPVASQTGPVAASAAAPASTNEVPGRPERPEPAPPMAQPMKVKATQPQRATRARTAVAQPPPIQKARLFIERPRWIEAPNGRTTERYYPRRSTVRLGEARVSLLCDVDGAGRLACVVESEEPRGSGFAEAAQRIARHYRMAPTLEDGRPTAGAQTRLNLTFRADR